MDIKFSIVPNVQKVNVPFPVIVFVKGTVHGAQITVTLSEEGGTFKATQVVPADATGFATAPFIVVLQSPGHVHLSADANDQVNGGFATSADSVQVIP